MEKSDSDLSGDWQIVSTYSVYVGEKNKTGELDADNSSVKTENKFCAEGSSVQDMLDQENTTHHDSSSSDIDVIDENLEESIPSCILPSSSLTISTSLDKSSDTCSGETGASSSEISNVALSQSENGEPTTNEENTTERNEYADDYPQPPFTLFGRPLHDWFNLLLTFLQNMSAIEWSVLLSLTFTWYIIITINQTNITTLQEKGDVVSQMKTMIDELKNDNKYLREQMLSEMKNDKLVSSFENQIRELKKENSKLNHMLYDVVKILEKQKDSQEKFLQHREEEYQAPLKKEINKLKEHINILKFDNEELQKQLVRMRYASYSQGGKHGDMNDKTATETKEKHQANENKELPSETPSLDLDQLKKWNELLDLVIKELGIVENVNTNKEKSDTKSGKKQDWSWKNFKSNVKGTFGDFSHINISDFLSKYMKYNERMLSNIYESLSTYFKKAHENAKPILDSFHPKAESPEQNNIWNVMYDLGEKWTQMKKKLYSSYLKKEFAPAEDFAKPGNSEDAPKIPIQQIRDKEKGGIIINIGFGPDEKAPQTHEESKKWVFGRAALREESRNAKEEESSINWFLKKGKNVLNDIFNDDKRNEESGTEKPKP